MPSQQQVRWSQLKVGLVVLVSSVFLVALHWYRTWKRDANEVFRPGLPRSSAVGACTFTA